MKKKKLPNVAGLNIPKKLLPCVTDEDVQRIREAQKIELIEREQLEKAERSKALREQMVTKDFDWNAAIATFHCTDKLDTARSLMCLLAVCCPSSKSIDATSGVMAGLKPKNMLEVLLLSQMAGAHMFAMAELGRAEHAETQETRDYYANRAARLMRVFTMQIDALKNLRSKGSRQRITVNHRHISVHGGQALIDASEGKRLGRG